MFKALFSLTTVLDETLDEQRKQGCTTYKTPRVHHQSPTLIMTNPVVHPLSITGLSVSSLAQLTTIPQHFTHFSPSVPAGQRHCGTGRVTPEREPDLGEREDASGVCKNATLRTVKFRKDPRLTIEDLEETGGLRDIDKVVVGRKASKKHKSKKEGGRGPKGMLWDEVKERA